MKRFALIIITALVSCLYAEPLHDLLRDYAFKFDSVGADCRKIAGTVQQRYPEIFFMMNEDGLIFNVLGANEVTDTVVNGNRIWMRKSSNNEREYVRSFEYDRLYLLIDEITSMIAASVPDIDFCSKSVSVKGNFLNSETFRAKIKEFKYSLTALIEMASVIKSKDSLFLPQYEPLTDIADLGSWRRWYDVMLDIQKLRIEKSLRRFKLKYGDKSDKINLLELLLVNQMPPFRGSKDGPSAWEPIARFTPVSYNFTDEKFVKALQAGINFYFFNGGFLKHLNHAGVAFLIADTGSEEIYHFNMELSYGIQIHLGKYQFGVIREHSTDDLKFTSTVDFQMVPGLF